MRKKIHWCPSHNNRMAENMILQSLCLSRKCGLLVKWKIERPNLLQSNQSSNPKSRLSLHSNHNILNQCSVFLGTWNVNGKKPEEPLDEWLLSTAVIPDIIAVGYVPLRRSMCIVYNLLYVYPSKISRTGFERRGAFLRRHWTVSTVGRVNHAHDIKEAPIRFGTSIYSTKWLPSLILFMINRCCQSNWWGCFWFCA